MFRKRNIQVETSVALGGLERRAIARDVMNEIKLCEVEQRDREKVAEERKELLKKTELHLMNKLSAILRREGMFFVRLLEKERMSTYYKIEGEHVLQLTEGELKNGCFIFYYEDKAIGDAYWCVASNRELIVEPPKPKKDKREDR